MPRNAMCLGDVKNTPEVLHCLAREDEHVRQEELHRWGAPTESRLVPLRLSAPLGT